MASSKKKQEEENLRVLREMVAMAHNKHCFDCNQRGPTYVDTTIGSFVCTSCSGLLRGLNPPHRVKSISMASFTNDEMEFIKIRGNAFCKRVWFGLHDGRVLSDLDLRDETKMRDLMGQKYEKKRWYVHPTEEFYEEARKLNASATQKQTTVRPISTLVGHGLPALNIGVNQTSKNAAVSSLPSSQPVQRPPHSGVPLSTGPLPSPARSSSQSPTMNQGSQPPQKSASLNILANFGEDPFAGTTSNDLRPNSDGFADFAAFGNQPPSSQKPGGQSQQHPQSTPSPWSTAPGATPLQPFHPGAKPNVAVAAPVTTAVDKYSALAELESVFSSMSGPSTVNWDGGSSAGTRGTGIFGSAPPQAVVSSGFGYGGTAGPPPPSYASLGTTVANPFGMNVSMSSQPAMTGFTQPHASGGFGQQQQHWMQQASATAGANNTSTVAGGYVPVNYMVPPRTIQNGGLGGGMMWGVMPPFQQSQVPQQSSGGWEHQVQANPFGGQAQPRANSVTNPFL